MRLILFGPPGVGKGTQAERIARKLAAPHISTGDILREAVRAGTEIGRKAKSFMEAGKLVPDDVMIGVIRERLAKEDCRAGYVLDGFPRTIVQAEALDDLLARIRRPAQAALFFTARDETVVERISGRRTCPTCQKPYHVRFQPPKKEGICNVDGGRLMQRPDDQEDKVRERLKNYRASTAPLADYYRKGRLLHEVPSEGSPDEVFAEVERKLAALAAAPSKKGP